MSISNKTRQRCRTLCLVSLLLLCGCAQLSQRSEQFGPDVQLPDSWQNQGKIGLRIHAQAPDVEASSHVLRYHWQQDGDNYIITLSGAFGLGAVVINRTEGYVTLSRGDEILATAQDSEELFYQHTGLRLPVSLLRYWITGAPGPRIDVRKKALKPNTEPLPKLAGFSQAGWHVSYPRAAWYDGINLPRKIVARNPQATLTVALAGWQL